MLRHPTMILLPRWWSSSLCLHQLFDLSTMARTSSITTTTRMASLRMTNTTRRTVKSSRCCCREMSYQHHSRDYRHDGIITGQRIRMKNNNVHPSARPVAVATTTTTRAVYFSTTTSTTKNNNNNNNDVKSNHHWSLHRLAYEMNVPTDRTIMGTIIEDIVYRLRDQYDRLLSLQRIIEHMIQQQQQQNDHHQQHHSTLDNSIKSIKALLVLHHDTMNIARSLHEQQCVVVVTNTNSTTSSSSSSTTTDDGCCWNQLQVHRTQKTMEEIHARHALTVESMAELLIDVRPIIISIMETSTTKPTTRRTILFDEYYDDDETNTDQTTTTSTTTSTTDITTKIEETVMEFLRTRLVIQLLCDHIIQLCKVYNKQQRKRQQQQKEQNKQIIMKQQQRRQQKEQRNQMLTTEQQQTQQQQEVFHYGTGAVTANVPIWTIIDGAIMEAKQLCEAHYLIRPTVLYVSNISVEHDNDDDNNNNNKINSTKTNNDDGEDGTQSSCEVTIIRPWLDYTLIELLKNSMAVTIESPINPKKYCTSQHKKVVFNNNGNYNDYDDDESNDDEYDDDDDDDEWISRSHCPIFVHVYETRTDIRIQIFDQGGGLSSTTSSSNKDHDAERISSSSSSSSSSVFRFAQRRTKWDRLQDQQTYATARSPIKGLGVGLALSKLQMHMFGGDVYLEDRPSLSSSTKSTATTTVHLDDIFTSSRDCRDASTTTARTKSNANSNNNNNVRDDTKYTLERGMTATICIPKNIHIPVMG